MGEARARVVIAILADAREAIRNIRDTGTEALTTGDRVKKGIGAAAIPAGAALGGLGAAAWEAGQAASEMSDTLSATNVVFGDASGAVEDFSNKAAKNFGISKQAALDAAGALGTIGKSAGLSGGDLSGFSNTFVGLAGDLASFKGGSPEDAITAITAAMRGESEPLRRYGILLDDATLRAQALKMGLISSTKDALTPQQKALAASQAILAQSKDAMGDFARTSDSAKNQQVALKAELSNVTAELGAQLLPAMSEGAKILGEFVGWVKENQGTATVLVAILGGLAAAILAVNIALKAYAAGQAIVSAATKVWTGIQWLLDAALNANPIGLIILAIAALVAGIIYAYKNSETFRKIVDAALRAIGAAFTWLWNAAKSVFAWLTDNWKLVLGIITGPVGLIIGLVVTYWDQIKGAFAAAWDWIKNLAVSVFDGIKSYFEFIISIYVAIFNGFMAAVRAIWSGIQWVYDKAVAVFQAVTGFIGGVLGWIQERIRQAVANVVAIWNGVQALWQRAMDLRDKLFGIFGDMVNRLLDVGRNIMRGLADGIQQGIQWVKDKVSGLGGMIPDWLKSVLGISSPSTVMARLGTNVMQGLTKGLESQVPALQSTLGGVTDTIAGLSADPTITLRTNATVDTALANGAGAGGAAVTYSITNNVAPGADPAEVGRQTVRAIEAWERRSGRRLLAAT